MCISLYNNGYNALHAKDGIEALEILEHNYVNLIISDIMMHKAKCSIAFETNKTMNASLRKNTNYTYIHF